MATKVKKLAEGVFFTLLYILMLVLLFRTAIAHLPRPRGAPFTLTLRFLLHMFFGLGLVAFFTLLVSSFKHAAVLTALASAAIFAFALPGRSGLALYTTIVFGAVGLIFLIMGLRAVAKICWKNWRKSHAR
ncbi:hypothetical protein [Maritalea mobilis]|uniref:hypothetical protein n=1 Tax=Maritalea mobilis TaxID=483324 RepID=UPI00105C5D28|nr:hypothetical protein [Maritalea mobilis]